MIVRNTNSHDLYVSKSFLSLGVSRSPDKIKQKIGDDVFVCFASSDDDFVVVPPQEEVAVSCLIKRNFVKDVLYGNCKGTLAIRCHDGKSDTITLDFRIKDSVPIVK